MTNTPPATNYFVRGGARLGFVTYGWPLATLEVDGARLSIATTFFGLFEAGRYSFRPDQIVHLETFRGLFSGGIRIHHTVPEYDEKVVFWCRSAVVLQGIASTGFCAAASDKPPSVSAMPPRGFPFKIWPLAVIGVLWNALLGYDFFSRPNFGAFPGPCSVLALSTVFLTSVAVLRSSRVQAVFLRPGRSIGEVRPLFQLIAIINGIMVVVFTAVFLGGLQFAK